MIVDVHNRCSDFNSYRAARVKSLFNVESGCDFRLRATLPVEEPGWTIGAVVGPSGSGKSSLGAQLWGGGHLYAPEWAPNVPIVDAVGRDASFDDVTAAFAAVGLGDVPAWLRPYAVLSNGERFRADLARLVVERPARVVVDEFTSVVDRQIAKVGAGAFQKAWRRGSGQVVVLSCHYDMLEWLQPDWYFDTATGTLTRGGLQRPRLALDVYQTGWEFWPMFEPHHYLKLPKMPAALCYVGVVEGEPVCHLAVGSAAKGHEAEARACRLVVLPEWQGAGIGLRFLNYVAELQLAGEGRLRGRKVTTVFHTSHPALCAALRRDRRWRQISAGLYGGNKRRSAATMKRDNNIRAGYGGHFRAVQGFRYYGAAGLAVGRPA